MKLTKSKLKQIIKEELAAVLMEDEDWIQDAEEDIDTSELDLHDMHLLPRRARPPPKYMSYYTDYSKRGYLNPKVQLERKKRGLKDL